MKPPFLFTALAVLLSVPTGDGQPSQLDYLSRPQFLATHGGFSFYKVWINPQLFRANQPITDDVVAATCIAASKGTPPMAPCQSPSPICKYFSNVHCKATSEQGCSQPMLTTALAMGCSSGQDPTCRNRAEQSLVGTNYGCLWAHMGLAWDNNGACGNCRCNSAAWGPTAPNAAPNAKCSVIESFCQPGRLYTTDGLIWPTCNPVAAPATPGAFQCTGGGTNAWPETPMEHWAFCVGRAVCKCVHGKCDIASELGYCMLGTCGPGWHGMLCNQPCGPSFCLGRNNPNVAPPAGVASLYNGVWTNNQNQCHCECTSQYGPSGTGPQGTVCGTCIQPGMLQCVAYTGTYLSSTTPVNSVARNTQFTVNVDARFVQNDQVDTSINEIITVSKDPGGGNGDGGQLTVHTMNAQMNQGQVTFVLEFSDACDACYLTFRDIKGILQPLKYGPIKVTTSSTHLTALTSHDTVAVGDTVIIKLQAVDGPVGSTGSVDTTSPGIIRARLQMNPSGGNGGGCSITPVAPTTSLTQNLVAGQAEWRLRFGCSCDRCVIVFEDLSTVRTLPTYYYAPVKVVSAARRLGCRLKTGGPCQPVALRRRDEVFEVVIQALDDSGNLDRTSTTTVTLTKQSSAGAGDGGQLLNAAGTRSLTQTLVNGEAEYALSFTQSCTACTIVATDVGGSSNPLLPYTFPTVSVVTNGVNLAIANTVPTQVGVGKDFTVVVEVRDTNANRDFMWSGKVGATLLPNGGNGNGGQLLNSDGSTALVKDVTNGTVTYRLKFTQSCTACIIEFTDVSASNQRLNPVQLPAMMVFSGRVALSTQNPAPSSVQKGMPFDVVIQAVDGSGNLDVTDSGRVSLSLVSGGGNGNGGMLTDPFGLERTLTNGRARFTLTFTQSCDMCYVEATHSSPDVPKLRIGPIKVISSANSLAFATQIPSSIPRNVPFPLTVRAVDGQGNLDTSPRGTFTLELLPGGNNGNGGDLTDAGVRSLTKQMIDGVVTFNPQFGAACQQCVLQIRDTSGQLPPLRTPAIVVTTRAIALRAISPWAQKATNQVAKQVRRGESYQIAVAAIDENGNMDMASQIPIAVNLEPGGENGGGVPMTTEPPSPQNTVDGQVVFQVKHDRACRACQLTFSAPSIPPLLLPPVEVITKGTRMMVVVSPPTSVPRNSQFNLQLQVVDENGDLDTEWSKQVAVRLVPGGGNGDGGTLLNQQAASLTQYFVKGAYTYRLSFTSACAACILEITDLTGSLPTLQLQPIKVTTETVRLDVSVPSGTMRGVPFKVEVRAVDDEGNVNTDDKSRVQMQLGELTSSQQLVSTGSLALQGGEPRQLSQGTTTFNLQIDDDCSQCVLSALYDKGSGGGNLATTERRLPRHDNALPAGDKSGSPDTRSDGDGDDTFQVLFWVVLVFVILLLLLLLAGCLYYMLKKKKKKTPKSLDNDAPKEPAELPQERSAEFEPMQRVPVMAPSEDFMNPIDQTFRQYESPSTSPPRGDRPWMVDVEASGIPPKDSARFVSSPASAY